MTFFTLLVTFLHVLQVCAYIPAQPSNVTSLGPGGVNTASLHLQWYTNGSDWEYVALQSVGPEAGNSPVQGIFVHFTEDSAGNETTATPWIALVSCDANSTNSSPEADVFTMAKVRGAGSAILYSLYSETCLIDPDYQSPALDVFTTQNLNSSLRIEYEFGQFGPSSEAYYGYFNAAMLNNAAGVFNDTIAFDYPTAPGFLFATLSAYNASGTGISNPELQSNTSGTGTTTSTGSSGSQNTGAAMIVLYAITGCVSALFCVVIVSGAIRAIRYPERYGPRSADPTLGGGQSRAGGLGRAILDTFPVVKFGNDREPSLPRPKDIESAPVDNEHSNPLHLPNSVQLAQLGSTAEHDEHHDDPREGTVTSTNSQGAREVNRVSEDTDQVDLSPQINPVSHGASRVPASRREADTRMPECIGRETCPICIVDFEEGDDLRVLPCEGKHRFHQSCVDPWLLELSGSCPICRQDFHALETIISGEQGGDASPVNRHSEMGIPNRLSRYLRFARRRQQRPTSGDPGTPPPPES